MFSATVHQVVKSLGWDTLTPVTSVDEADNIRPFSLLLKERRKIIFCIERCRYLSTEFSLQDILSEPFSEKEKAELMQTEDLAVFNYETDFSWNGRLDVELQKIKCELMEVELEGSAKVTVTSSLGELTKEEVDLPAFLTQSRGRTLKLGHELLAPLPAEPTKTLCLVTGVVRLKNAAKLTSVLKWRAARDAKYFWGQVVRDGDVSDSKSKTLELPAGLALAYTFYELQVRKKDGQFTLVLDKSKRGGFVSSLSVDLDEGNGSPAPSAVSSVAEEQDTVTDCKTEGTPAID